MITSLFLSGDWGTSSLRLRLVERAGGRVLAAVSGAAGIRPTFGEWEASSLPAAERAVFFLARLRPWLDQLEQAAGRSLAGLPLVLSGMASSSIGLRELPYAPLPFRLDGADAVWERLPATPGFPHEVLLLSGVRSDDDVMRGEETQALGLPDYLVAGGGVFVFPGTHSKHMVLEHGAIITFKTFLTGELFDILCTHSVLRNSLTPEAMLPDGQWEAPFTEGVARSARRDLLHDLFLIRGRHVLGRLRPEQAYYYLSGLLIGHELRSLTDAPELPVVLCAEGALAAFYRQAAKAIGLTGRLRDVPAGDRTNLAVEGQRKVLNLQKD